MRRAPVNRRTALSDSLYDEVPYPGHPFAQTHPDRLATLATLFGLRPPPVGRCRVLELGCGDGGNLVPMAVTLPGARFLGIDAVASAIERGRRLVQDLGLDNVALDARAIEHLAPEGGGFDYVIAHGVYSWVAQPVRERLLAVCRDALAPGGVAYVSYNALPGWRLRQALRDALRFHTAATEDPREQIEEARAFLRLLLEGWPLMRTQVEQLLSRSDAGLLHDELAPINEPVSFHEFVEHAGRHRLQYLAEADFFEMQIGAAPERITATLLGIDDLVRREQYLDFIKGRMFRQTLLCRAEETVDRSPHPAVILDLAVSTQVVRRDGAFEGPTGSRISIDRAAVVDALQRAANAWPAAVPVRDLTGDHPAAVCDALLRAYAANLVTLHVHPPPLTTTPGAAPRASALVRHQAREGDTVTNLRHATVRIEDELGRHLVTLLDGTRDRAALAAGLRGFLTGRGEELGDDELRGRLERSLQGLARLALLQG